MDFVIARTAIPVLCLGTQTRVRQPHTFPSFTRERKMTKLLTLTTVIAIGSWVGVEAYVAVAYLAASMQELATASLAIF